MRIAIITSHINKSNQWNWFSEILNQRDVFHIHIIINHYEPIMLNDINKLGVPVYFLKHNNLFSFIFNFIKVVFLLRKFKIDTEHTELPYGNLIGQLAAIACSIKQRVLSCSSLTWGIDHNNIKQRINDVISFRLSKYVIAHTILSKKYLVETYNLKDDHVTVIPHALKTEEYLEIPQERVAALKSHLCIPSDRFVIGLISRFVFWKGVEYVIKAMVPVVKKHPETLLIIFGDEAGDSFTEVMKLIRQLQLQDHVKHVGFVPDNVALYSMIDIQVHVPVDYYVETFGIVVIEGMISSCPQVLTISGIVSDTGKDGENCMIVDHCSSNQIADAVLLLMSDPELRMKISSQAKSDAMKMFQYKDKVEKHMALYASY